MAETPLAHQDLTSNYLSGTSAYDQTPAPAQSPTLQPNARSQSPNPWRRRHGFKSTPANMSGTSAAQTPAPAHSPTLQPNAHRQSPNPWQRSRLRPGSSPRIQIRSKPSPTPSTRREIINETQSDHMANDRMAIDRDRDPGKRDGLYMSDQYIPGLPKQKVNFPSPPSQIITPRRKLVNLFGMLRAKF